MRGFDQHASMGFASLHREKSIPEQGYFWTADKRVHGKREMRAKLLW